MSAVLSFFYYSFVSGITPGPANICSLSTAIRMGRKIALRQWRGLFVGYCVVSISSALITWFIGTAFADYVRYFSFVGAIYIIWLAIHILRDRGNKENADEETQDNSGKFGIKEGTFWFGFLLQITNVKIIIFCLTAFTGYVLPYRNDFLTIMIVGLILPFIGPFCNLVWLFLGATMQSFFEKYRKMLNIVMALSLVLCAVSMVVW